MDIEKIDKIVDRFGLTFPSTSVFSKIARDIAIGVDPRGDPDHALVTWLEHEETLFRRLEQCIVQERLQKGFMKENEPDVDGFIKFSLSVHNRRKSRMGYSLEHHLSSVLEANEVSFTHGAVIEGKQRPDFLFPSLEVYYSAMKDDPRLVMLGVKSTCRERWLQVLMESDKISRKHLFTIDRGITSEQMDRMEDKNLKLVVPLPVQKGYSKQQQKKMCSLFEFIEDIKMRQKSHVPL